MIFVRTVMAITCLIMSTFKTKLIQSRRSGPQSVRVKLQEWTGQLERVKFSKLTSKNRKKKFFVFKADPVFPISYSGTVNFNNKYI